VVLLTSNFATHSSVTTCHWLTALWGTAAVLLSVRNIYSKVYKWLKLQICLALNPHSFLFQVHLQLTFWTTSPQNPTLGIPVVEGSNIFRHGTGALVQPSQVGALCWRLPGTTYNLAYDVGAAGFAHSTCDTMLRVNRMLIVPLVLHVRFPIFHCNMVIQWIHKKYKFVSISSPICIGDNSAVTPKYTYTYYEGDCIVCISLKRTVIYINAMNRVRLKAICNVCKRRWLSDRRLQLTISSKITYFCDDTRII